MRYELFTALDLAGEPPRHPSEFDRLLKTALAERPRTFLVDEAQWLNGEAFEYFRYLWDEPSTQLAIIFVGGEGCHTVLRREPMLSSRIFIWQHFTRLTPARSWRPSPCSIRCGRMPIPTTSLSPTSTPHTATFALGRS